LDTTPIATPTTVLSGCYLEGMGVQRFASVEDCLRRTGMKARFLDAHTRRTVLPSGAVKIRQVNGLVWVSSNSQAQGGGCRGALASQQAGHVEHITDGI